MSFRTRKEDRRKHFEDHVKGRKLITCTACSGSGYYDTNGSPDCGSCNGTGKELDNINKGDRILL